MKERAQSEELATTLDLERYMSKDRALATVELEADDKPKPTRKRAPKKDAAPKLKLDKKPPTERKPRKKKDSSTTIEQEVIARREEATPLGDLQIFEYKVPGDEEGTIGKLKSAKTTETAARLSTKSEGQDKAEKQEHIMFNDLQIFEYKGPEDDEPVAKAAPAKKPRKPRQKKADTEDGQAQLSGAKVTKPRGRSKSAVKGKELSAGEGSIAVATRSAIVDGMPQEDVPQITIETAETEMVAERALSPALKRRRDWTPPKTTEVVEPEANEPVTGMIIGADTTGDTEMADVEEHNEDTLSAPSKAFLDLKGSFGYNEQNTTTRKPSPAEEALEPALKKRRVEVNVPSR